MEIILTRKGEGKTTLQFKGEDVLLMIGIEEYEEDVIVHKDCNLYIDGELTVRDIAETIFKR